ncbi:MAG: Mur ligase domain-containing protein [Candidatus Nanosyncoccus sp.]
MNIYISGISGTGMGPLALMTKNAGYNVFGSDQNRGAISDELDQANIPFEVGNQDGSFLKQIHESHHLDWFVYTSALPEDHPELKLAKSLGLKISKRDELTAYLVKTLGLKMIAIAGTHGKTTTTAMLIWVTQKLQLPAAYIVGSTLSFALSGSYHPNDQYFIYEADEYDRNFLHYEPWLSLITFVSYDHPDIYPSEADYHQAFLQFEKQSQSLIFASPAATPPNLSILSGHPLQVLNIPDPRFTLAGSARREDANLVFHAIKQILADQSDHSQISDQQILDILNQFPGVGRRFERLKDGLYSDYAHHPEEIKATVEIAKEEAEKLGKTGVVVVYEPHQNTRQHEVSHLYKNVFQGVDHLFWLPTYLTRENQSLKIFTPSDFIKTLDNQVVATPAELNEDLKSKLKDLHQQNYLIILMSAGPADQWFRDELLPDLN